MAKRLCLDDDLKMLKITMSNTSSRNKLNLEINDHYNILTGECQKVELKTKDKALNKSVPAVHESVQPWLSNLARRQDPRESFDELTDTTFDFSAFVMNRLNVTTLTPELSLQSHNRKIPNDQGRHVIPFHHFINIDLEYLRGGKSSRKYSTSVMKTKAADYGQIKWIEDLVLNSMWSQE
ncbi:hypothetical protein Tco_0021704 [Tanacetum coccineum]